jgi:hypothetical protein
MRTLLYRVCAVAVLLFLLTALGCKVLPPPKNGNAPPRRADVVVKVDEKLAAEKTVSVDIIGVRELEHHPWNVKMVDAYWRRGDKDREKADPYEMREFDKPDLNPRTLGTNDPIWERWERKGVKYLFVIADIPGVRIDKDRKLVYDLTEVRGKTIQLRVTEEKLEPVQ